MSVSLFIAPRSREDEAVDGPRETGGDDAEGGGDDDADDLEAIKQASDRGG